jgi:hypothetical protein
MLMTAFEDEVISSVRYCRYRFDVQLLLQSGNTYQTPLGTLTTDDKWSPSTAYVFEGSRTLYTNTSGGRFRGPLDNSLSPSWTVLNNGPPDSAWTRHDNVAITRLMPLPGFWCKGTLNVAFTDTPGSYDCTLDLGPGAIVNKRVWGLPPQGLPPILIGGWRKTSPDGMRQPVRRASAVG